jgi:hypothetical protein
MTIHEQLTNSRGYLADNAKGSQRKGKSFCGKGRKALAEIAKLAKSAEKNPGREEVRVTFCTEEEGNQSLPCSFAGPNSRIIVSALIVAFLGMIVEKKMYFLHLPPDLLDGRKHGGEFRIGIEVIIPFTP